MYSVNRAAVRPLCFSTGSSSHTTVHFTIYLSLETWQVRPKTLLNVTNGPQEIKRVSSYVSQHFFNDTEEERAPYSLHQVKLSENCIYLGKKNYVWVNIKAQAPPQNIPVCTSRNNQSVLLIGYSYATCIIST